MYIAGILVLILGAIIGGGGDGRKVKNKNKKKSNVFIAVKARIS